jgi:hypothetical protein
MKKLLVITEVFFPERFIINDVVGELSKHYDVTVITRTPTYPEGILYSGFKNNFSVSYENGIRIFRYPVFTNYNQIKFFKILNLVWQPFIILFLSLFLNWNKMFCYQTGSIYSYSCLFFYRFSNKDRIIWSQDLWPEAAFANGLPNFFIIRFFLQGLTKSTLKNFSKVLVQSNSFKTYYLKTYGIYSKVVLNYSMFSKSSVYVDRKNFSNLIYAGNIGSVQNLEGLIQLFLNLRKSSLNITTLDIYGIGSLFNEIKLEYSQFKDVVFHGKVSQEDLINIIQNCRFAIFSLKTREIQNTIPGRLQFFYNNNVPLLYLGSGEPADFIEFSKGGVIVDSISDSLIVDKIKKFEKGNFLTFDYFNRDNILKELLNHIS